MLLIMTFLTKDAMNLLHPGTCNGLFESGVHWAIKNLIKRYDVTILKHGQCIYVLQLAKDMKVNYHCFSKLSLFLFWGCYKQCDEKLLANIEKSTCQVCAWLIGECLCNRANDLHDFAIL